MRRPKTSQLCLALCAGLAGACSSAGTPELTSGLPAQVADPASTAAPSAAAPSSGLADSLPNLSALTNLTKGVPVGSPTDVYTRVARGALTCWFGASGPLKGPYIYHADAEPPSKGGRAEIDIRNRDATAADPRSLKAFRVGISPSSDGTHVDVENATIPEPLATRLGADAHRWAAGEEGCGEAPVVAGWSAAPGTDPAKTKESSKKSASGKAVPTRAGSRPVIDVKN